jgi:hypothetical protein
MQLTLYVLGLLLPDAICAASVYDLAAPALSRILGRAQRLEIASGWLTGAFGIDFPGPAAALRKVGADGTAAGEWICLDPVHLQVTREGISLSDPAELDLTEAEAGILIDAVQPLFAGWGEISSSAPTRWEMRLNRPLALETRALPEVVAQPVDPALPGGTDGREWRRILSEIQTVLHTLAINPRREALGKPTVNSLWPWGAGPLPGQIQANFSVTWSDDPVIAGLCAHAGMPCLAASDRFQLASGRVLASVNKLEHPARRFDALAWRDNLLAFDQNWLAPALAAVKKGDCQELRLIGTCVNGPATVAYVITRSVLRRFWKRPVPLTALGVPA